MFKKTNNTSPNAAASGNTEPEIKTLANNLVPSNQIPQLDILSSSPKELRGEMLNFTEVETRKAARLVCHAWKEHWETWMQEPYDRWKKRVQDEFPHFYEDLFERYKKNPEDDIAKWNGDNIQWHEKYFLAFSIEYKDFSKEKIKLFRIVKAGDLEALKKESLNFEVIFNCWDQRGFTLVTWAAIKGHAGILGYFWNFVVTGRDYSYLLAARLGQLKIIKERRIPLAPFPTDRGALLHGAALYCQVEVVEYLLLEQGMNPNVRDENDEQPLHFAAKKGDVRLIKLLLNQKADVDGRDPTSVAKRATYTPLYYAAQYNRIGAVRLLLKSGADLYQPCGQYDRTPLHIAAHEGNFNIVKILLDQGAYINVQTKTGVTPLILAAYNGHWEVVQLLCDRRANVHVSYSEGTALHQAVIQGTLKTIQILIEAGACIHARPAKNGLTPLHCAAAVGNLAMVEFLLEKGAIIDADSTEGTALYLAAFCNRVNVVKFLLAKGADVKWHWAWETFLLSENTNSVWLFKFEFAFRAILSLLQKSSGDSFFPRLTQPQSLEKLQKDLHARIQKLNDLDSKYLENRLSLFLKDQDGCSLLDPKKFRCFCKILLDSATKNPEIRSLASQYTQEVFSESQCKPK